MQPKLSLIVRFQKIEKEQTVNKDQLNTTRVKRNSIKQLSKI